MDRIAIDAALAGSDAGFDGRKLEARHHGKLGRLSKRAAFTWLHELAANLQGAAMSGCYPQRAYTPCS